MTFEAEISTKLKTLNETQAQIQTISTYLVFHRRRAAIVAEVWRQEIASCPPEQVLPLLYLINDVLQVSRKNGSEFVDAFAPLIVDVLSSLKLDNQAIPRVQRLLNVWDERQVFGKAIIAACLSRFQPQQPVVSEVASKGGLSQAQQTLAKLHSNHVKLYAAIKEEHMNAQMKVLKRDNLQTVVEARKIVVSMLNSELQSQVAKLKEEVAQIQALTAGVQSVPQSDQTAEPKPIDRQPSPRKRTKQQDVQDTKKPKIEQDEEYDPFDGEDDE